MTVWTVIRASVDGGSFAHNAWRCGQTQRCHSCTEAGSWPGCEGIYVDGGSVTHRSTGPVRTATCVTVKYPRFNSFRVLKHPGRKGGHCWQGQHQVEGRREGGGSDVDCPSPAAEKRTNGRSGTGKGQPEKGVKSDQQRSGTQRGRFKYRSVSSCSGDKVEDLCCDQRSSLSLQVHLQRGCDG